MALCVKTYPDLNIAAMQTKQDRELAIWYLLRFLDPEGNAKVPRDRFLRFIQDNSIMSQDNAKRRLRRGHGIFWDLVKMPKGVQIQYRSLKNLSAHFGILPRKLPVGIPLEAFKGLGNARAYLYATWLNQGSNPISRQSIERDTGLPKKTQLRYEKRAKVAKEKNMAIKPYDRDDQIPLGGFVSRDGKTLNIPMANSYLPLLEQLARGQLRKVRRHLRGVLEGTPSDSIKRCYFRSGEEAAKCKRRRKVFYVDNARTWRGYHLWAYQSV